MPPDRHPPKEYRIFQNLPQNLATYLLVLCELCFDDKNIPIRIDPKQIGAPRTRFQAVRIFKAYRGAVNRRTYLPESNIF